MPWLEKLFKKRKETEEKGVTGEQETGEGASAVVGAADGQNNVAAGKKEKVLRYARYLMVCVTLVFLVWYLGHPAYFIDEEEKKTLMTNGRTYFMFFMTAVLYTLIITPNRLSERANRILGWIWFAAAPLAIYATLFHMDSTRFHIVFGNLSPIAVSFTFIFLYLLVTILMLMTGSVRIPAIVVSVAVAALGIVNWFVVDFRGMALSAADLFSIREAATVASGYTYDIDWYVFSEVFLTFAICVVSCKIRGFKVMKFVPRVAVLCTWLVVAGGYYHICCRTSFLEDHDIRSQGFTHQLRYKQFDMLFTTLCTCFYLAADKPEGYSIDKVKEIGEAYVKADKEENSGDGSRAVRTEGADQAAKEKEELPAQNVENRSALMRSVGGSRAAAAENEEGAAGAEEAGDDGAGIRAEEAGDDEAADPAVTGVSAGGDSRWNTPNLIVIMNESFADYTSIGRGLDLSQDCMPFIHGLTENTIKGTAYVSIFGGNTPNSEYEFLTGNTMGFLPESSVGFNLFVRGDMPSIVSELKTAGYDAIAIHPYRGNNYRRHIVYPQLGFDAYYTRDDFENPEYIRKYISDWELSEKIIREYLNHLDTGKPLLSYNVTIQNHGGYTSSNTAGLHNVVRVRSSRVDRVKTSIYVNLIKRSDDVYEKLVNYFTDREEPVAILMFGDHQANLGDNTYEYLLGKTEEELTPEERMEKYKVPFVLWANYDIEEEVIEKTSLNYLYSIVADRLGLPLTGYQEYLLDLSEEIPVLAAGGYWTADGEFYELKDEDSPYFEKINDYNILEYNYIFGDDDRYLDLFSLS